jgi:hypothetical protein
MPLLVDSSVNPNTPAIKAFPFIRLLSLLILALLTTTIEPLLISVESDLLLRIAINDNIFWLSIVTVAKSNIRLVLVFVTVASS